MRLGILAAATAALISPLAIAQSLSVETGKWETSHTFTGTVVANGMSMELPGQTRTSTQCISADDATLKPEQMSGEGCTVSNVQQAEKTMSFDITCNQGGSSMQGTMKAEASDDGQSVSGTMTMAGSQPGGASIDMTGDFSGELVGACS